MRENLEQIIENTQSIVFFGGAGVSTESGIPDFRSADGLYFGKHQYPPETILSHDFFIRNPEAFFAFYKSKMIAPTAKPNKAHLALAALEKQGKLQAVVTQNIDGLHQAAGSQTVLELHGSVQRNYCMRCRKFFDVATVLNSDGVPKCSCGGIIKPDVVLYGEPLNNKIMETAINNIKRADVLIVGGTSLAVYPAAGLIEYYKGNRLILINKEKTPLDFRANLVIHEPIGEVLGELLKL
ncbi:MAG: NAD-dependent protein deacylase [Oscillospiraceae bacterium]